jgi:UPF0271 protein
VIELSADMGEGGETEPDIWPLIDTANVACGGHYGDEASMRAAVRGAREHSVKLGAHPSYPDRENFGRTSMVMSGDDLFASLVTQMNALRSIAASENVHIVHAKAHGALYNEAHKRRELADVLVAALRHIDVDLAIVAPDRSEMSSAARAAGTRVIREAFADRRYEPDGSLVPRKIEGSTLTVEEAAAQAALLAREGAVIARDGSRVVLPFDTLCIHSDMPGARERIRAVRATVSAQT